MRYDWNYGHMSAAGWLLASVLWLLLVGILVLGIVALVRHLQQPSMPSQGGTVAPAAPTPEEVLALRLARGEIDPDEYERRVAALRGRPTS